MRIYLDDDSAAAVLIRLLRQASHEAVAPTETGLAGAHEAVHLERAIADNRVLLSGNHNDFRDLHRLVMRAGGHHPGILIVRRDNDTRDLKPAGVVRAIAKLEASGMVLTDLFLILNQWR